MLSVAAGIACAIGVGFLGLKVLFHCLIDALYCKRNSQVRTMLSVAAGIACAIGVGYLGLQVLFH